MAQYTGGPSGTTEFVHQDHLGSTRLLTALNGSVAECDDYLAFGELLPYSGCNNTQTTTHKFTSKERDLETNLDYFGARFYTSSLGRFVTSDWALTPEAVPYATFTDPHTLNLYAYVRNNPLGHEDADGHDNLNYSCMCAVNSQQSHDTAPGSPTEIRVDAAILSTAAAITAVGGAVELAASEKILGTILSSVSASASVTSAGINIVGAATGKDTKAATDGANAVTTPAGLAVTLKTGDASKGSAASDIQNAATAVASPKAAAGDLIGTGLSLKGAYGAIKSYFSTPPAPRTPQTPRPPTQSLTSSDSSDKNQ